MIRLEISCHIKCWLPSKFNELNRVLCMLCFEEHLEFSRYLKSSGKLNPKEKRKECKSQRMGTCAAKRFLRTCNNLYEFTGYLYTTHTKMSLSILHQSWVWVWALTPPWVSIVRRRWLRQGLPFYPVL